MNQFITAIRLLNAETVRRLLKKNPDWIRWAEPTGKNALHFLCAIPVEKDRAKAGKVLQMVKRLVSEGMYINAVHRIPDSCGFFPATPLWYAYTRGRNQPVVTYLLEQGADPEHCMFAIAWYDDVKAAALFKKYGAVIDDGSTGATPFLAAVNWKRFKIAKWLLEQGANVNAPDEKGDTALHYAVRKKYPVEVLSFLLSYHADPNVKNHAGISPGMGNNEKTVENSFFAESKRIAPTALPGLNLTSITVTIY